MKSPLLPIFLTVFVDVLGLTLILPLLPYYVKDYGGTDFQAGLLTSVYAIAMFLSGPVLGRISDRVGRKPVLIASQIGTLLGWLVLAAAPNLTMLFVGRTIAGLTAGNLSIAQAYISDVTKPNEERTHAFGFFGMAFGMGFLLGPGITALLTALVKDHPDKLFKYKPPTLMAAGLSLLSIILTATLLPARKPTTVAARSWKLFLTFFTRPTPRKRLLQFLLFSLSFSSLTGGLSIYLQHQFHYELHQTGLIFMLSGFIGATVQGGLLRRLAKKLGEDKLAIIGLATMAAGYLLLGFAHNLAFLLVLVALGSLGAAVVRPALTTLITRSVAPSEQGSVLGANQSLGSLAQAVAPPLACWLIGREQTITYGVVCGVFSITCALFMLLSREDEPSEREAPEQGAPVES